MNIDEECVFSCAAESLCSQLRKLLLTQKCLGFFV